MMENPRNMWLKCLAEKQIQYFHTFFSWMNSKYPEVTDVWDWEIKTAFLRENKYNFMSCM